MREMQTDEKKAYEMMKNMKEKYGTFHKTCFHVHTPASHDYTLIQDWNSQEYNSASDEDLFSLCVERGVISDVFSITSLPTLEDELAIYKDKKEFLSYLLLANELFLQKIEIVVITDHHTIDGYEKVKKAVAKLYQQQKYDIYPEVFLGIEISCADRNHVVGIFDSSSQSSISKLQEWLEDNLINVQEGTFLTSLDVLRSIEEFNGIGYIAHINTAEIFQEKYLSGAYKKKLFSDAVVSKIGLSDLEKKEFVENKVKNYRNSPVQFILDNDAHDIDSIGEKAFYLKGRKRNFSMLTEAFCDYDISVSFEQKKAKKSYIKGLYVKNSEKGFLSGKEDDDFCLNFSDALNCLIGGRGTGKSSVLEILEYIMCQYCRSESLLDFICAHGNAWVLYEYDGEEYLIEMRMPEKDNADDNILTCFGQNLTRRYYFSYYYNEENVKDYAFQNYLKIHKVVQKDGGCKLEVVKSKRAMLERFFDTAYSINGLVQAASEGEIGNFIQNTILKNKGLSKPEKLRKPKSRDDLLNVISEMKKKLSQRKDTVDNIIAPFNLSQKGKLRIVYTQKGVPEDPDFAKWLFGQQYKKTMWYKNYNITQGEVVEYLLNLYDKMGITSFVEMILTKNIRKAQNLSNLFDFCVPFSLMLVEEEIREITEENIEMMLQTLFDSVITDQNVFQIKEYLDMYIKQLEEYSLEFNINNKAGAAQKEIYRPVNALSLGQKVVAMMTFILGYSDYSGDYRPLIIDQPEDNLDNQYIYKNLVAQLREIKEKRQVIIATHNSTLVTNAKADQVCLMCSDNEHGWVETTGYPGEEKIKKHIINYLEGGEESFKHKMAMYKIVLDI